MYYIGIDLGGTNTAGGIVNEKGELICKKSVPTDAKDTENLVKNIGGVINSLCEENGFSQNDIKAVGIGVPGTVDSKTGTVVYANNIKMDHFPIVEKLKAYTDIPVYISNDANVAALGEAVAGGAKGYDSVVVVTLGTGVGGGIILDNKIWEGYMCAGAEIGHMVIEVDGEDCTCGRKGCWESYSSATALIRDTKRAITKNPDSLMCKLSKEEGKVSGKTAFLAAKIGDKAAQEVVDRYIKYLAEGIANVINLLAPKCVLIGGGISYEGDNLLIPLKEAVRPLQYGGDLVDHAEIKLCTLGNDAGIIGAAMLGR